MLIRIGRLVRMVRVAELHQAICWCSSVSPPAAADGGARCSEAKLRGVESRISYSQGWPAAPRRRKRSHGVLRRGPPPPRPARTRAPPPRPRLRVRLRLLRQRFRRQRIRQRKERKRSSTSCCLRRPPRPLTGCDKPAKPRQRLCALSWKQLAKQIGPTL